MGPRGYVRLWRCIMADEVWKEEALLKVFLWCLMKAAPAPCDVEVAVGRAATIVHLQRGQFVFGRVAASKELGQAGSSVARRMQLLATLGAVSIRAESMYSVVTICNYDRYQGATNTDAPEAEDPVVVGRRKLKPGSKSKRHRRKSDYPPEIIELVDRYATAVAPLADETRARGWRNVEALLAAGYAMDELRAAVANYADHIRRAGTEPKYRTRVGNFFGEKATYQSFLPDEYASGEAPPLRADDGDPEWDEGD